MLKEEPTAQTVIAVSPHPSLDPSPRRLVHSRRFKQCPECRRWVEKEDGCNHMICVCSAKFCYRCGNSLKGGARYDAGES